MELDPKYVQTAVRRWEAYSGEDAVHVETGLTLHDLCEVSADDRRVLQEEGPEADAVRQRSGPKEAHHAG